MVDKISLKPTEGEQEPSTKDETPTEEKLTETPPQEEKLFTNLLEREAQYTMNQLIDICAIYQSTPNLPETTEIKKTANFYIEEIIKILMDHGIITQ